jgi:hypothetical protein
VQHVTVLNTVGNCNTIALKYTIYYNILYYNIGLLDHRRIYGPSLTETSLWRMTVPVGLRRERVL